MKITHIESFMVNVPYTKPEKWSWGIRLGSSPIIVKVHTDEGLVGLGEATSPFTTPVIQKILEEHIIPQLIGEDPTNIERLLAKIMATGLSWVLNGSTQAVAAVEMALWDLAGKAVGKPVHKLLGGLYRSKIPFGAYLFNGTPEQMATDASEFVKQGITTVKMKVGIDMMGDIERVRAVREAVGPNVQIIVDPNQSWTLGTAVRQIRKMAEFDLMFIEQPVKKDDLEGMRYVRHTAGVPIGANESVTTPSTALEVIRREAADLLVTDVEVAGGIWALKKIAHIAEAAGLPVIGHSGGELGIATAALLHVVASSPSFIYPNDTYYYYMADDIITEPFEMKNGVISVPNGPGLGIELDEEKVEKYGKGEFFSAFTDNKGELGWMPSSSRV